MSGAVEGGAPTVLLTGDYIYRCGLVPSARCVFSVITGQQLIFYILDPVKGKGAEIERVDIHSVLQNSVQSWSLSPDGNRIAIVDPTGNRGEVRILALTDRKAVTLALQGWKWNNLQSVSWAADGNHLFATAWGTNSTAILLIDQRGNLQMLAELTNGEAWPADLVASPDGRFLAYRKRTFESNVMMLEHF